MSFKSMNKMLIPVRGYVAPDIIGSRASGLDPFESCLDLSINSCSDSERRRSAMEHDGSCVWTLQKNQDRCPVNAKHSYPQQNEKLL